MSNDNRKLTGEERSFISLVARSRDIGEGWRKVSPLVWGLAKRYSLPELIETEETTDGGGRVRFTEAGKLVSRYL